MSVLGLLVHDTWNWMVRCTTPCFRRCGRLCGHMPSCSCCSCGCIEHKWWKVQGTAASGACQPSCLTPAPLPRCSLIDAITYQSRCLSCRILECRSRQHSCLATHHTPCVHSGCLSAPVQSSPVCIDFFVVACSWHDMLAACAACFHVATRSSLIKRTYKTW